MERRRHQRFPVRFRSSFASVNIVNGTGDVLDLSIRGCKVDSDIEVRPGTNLMLTLVIPELESPIEIAVAGVRWSQGRAFGVEFHDMKEDDWKRFTSLIDRLEHGGEVTREGTGGK